MSLPFLIRLIHIAAMALLLGGALLLSALAWKNRKAPDNGPLEELMAAARAYERLFWLPAGLIVLTGIGNLGVFGAGLPGPGTSWGKGFLIKMGGVALLLLISIYRSLLVTGARQTHEPGRNPHSEPALLPLYGGTALILLTIVFLGVWLSHGPK